MNTHTGTLGDSEDAEAVIQYLDVYGGETDLDFVKHHNENKFEGYKRNRQYLTEEKLRDFASFTPKQANAIYAWLMLARTWSELQWYLNDIDRAAAYWLEASNRQTQK
jgi:hypothetical protein